MTFQANFPVLNLLIKALLFIVMLGSRTCSTADIKLVTKPEDASVIVNQTHILRCEFDLNVNCSWERNHIPVEITKRYSFADGHNRSNEFTSNCSLKIVNITSLDSGIWVCHGRVKADKQLASSPASLTIYELPRPTVTIDSSNVIVMNLSSYPNNTSSTLTCFVNISDVFTPELKWILNETDITDAKDKGIINQDKRTIVWSLKNAMQIVSNGSQLRCVVVINGQRSISNPVLVINTFGINKSDIKVMYSYVSWITWSLVAIFGLVGLTAVVSLIIFSRYSRHASLNVDTTVSKKPQNSKNVIVAPGFIQDRNSLCETTQTLRRPASQMMDTTFNNNTNQKNNESYKKLSPVHPNAENQLQHLNFDISNNDPCIPFNAKSSNGHCTLHQHNSDDELYVDGLSLCEGASSPNSVQNSLPRYKSKEKLAGANHLESHSESRLRTMIDDHFMTLSASNRPCHLDQYPDDKELYVDATYLYLGASLVHPDIQNSLPEYENTDHTPYKNHVAGHKPRSLGNIHENAVWTSPSPKRSCNLDQEDDDELYVDGMSLYAGASILGNHNSLSERKNNKISRAKYVPFHKQRSLGDIQENLNMTAIPHRHEVLCQKCSDSVLSWYSCDYSS